jgi:hypothetical protein
MIGNVDNPAGFATLYKVYYLKNQFGYILMMWYICILLKKLDGYPPSHTG